jgi:hypothetical protein
MLNKKIWVKITLIDSRVKLKKKTVYKRNQVKNLKSKERGSNLKPKQNKRKNNVSMLEEENKKKIDKRPQNKKKIVI